MPKKKDSPDSTEEVVEETTPTTDQQEDDNWEERYKGMQRLYNKKKEDFDKLQEKQDALVEESETSKVSESALQEQLEANQKALEEQQKELDNMTGQLASQEAKVVRKELIMSDFPELAPFEAQGLLPDVPIGEKYEDEMKTKFASFRDVYQNTVQGEVKKQVTGAGPTETGDGGEKVTRSKAYVYNRLQQLAGSTDQKDRLEYDELLKEWDEAVAQETT